MLVNIDLIFLFRLQYLLVNT